MSRKKTLAIAAPILILVVWLCLETGHQRFDISAICPRCLQHAYIHEYRVFGVPVYRSTRLAQNPGGIMSPALFSPDVPQVSPHTYERIVGAECDHVFRKGGVGRTRGLLFRLEADGGSAEWQAYNERIEAVESLYVAFGNCGDKALARKTYEIIDAVVPIDRHERVSRAAYLFRRQDEDAIGRAERTEPEVAAIVRGMRMLAEMAPRLKEIATEEQWAEFLAEIEKEMEPSQAEAVSDAERGQDHEAHEE